MPTPEQYDVVVLGSGEAGKYIAWTQAKKGKRAVVIERRYIGGSFPHIPRLPSKKIIHNAKVASYFPRSEKFCITKNKWQNHIPRGPAHKPNKVHRLPQYTFPHFQ